VSSFTLTASDAILRFRPSYHIHSAKVVVGNWQMDVADSAWTASRRNEQDHWLVELEER
jgi:hypothetical protein